MPRKKKQKTIGKLKEEAAVLLQKLRRMESADDQGYCKCCTCDKILHWKEMQGGHFHGRRRSGTLLDERNIHPQCAGDNAFFMKTTEGILKYQDFMLNTYGQEVFDELRENAQLTVKWDRIYLEDKIAEYKERIKEQEERLGD